MRVDLRDSRFDDWVDFIFDHPVPFETSESTPEEWYWSPDLDVVVDPVRQITFLAQFCVSASRLLGRFSPKQIDQGLWYAFSAGGEDTFWGHLWNPAVPWEVRERCIMTIPLLWPQLFERTDVGSMAFMLWDSLAYGYHCGNRKPGDDVEDHRVQDAMYRALVQQLVSPIPETRQAALHGLGHLRHPDTQAQILAFLARSDVDADSREYAEQILTGRFQ